MSIRHQGKDGLGYVLDVQADLLSELGTRVVVLTQFIAAIPKKQLGKPLLSLKARSENISRALDFLLFGF